MAAGWSVILEQGESEIALGAGKSLFYYHRHIDDLAERLGLTPLSDFFSRSRADILAYLRDAGVERDPETIPDEEWFEAAEGLATVQGLLAHLRDEPASVPEPGKVVADLEVVERALRAAVETGMRFHLGRALSLPERET